MAVWTGGNGSYLFVADVASSNIVVFTITGTSSNPLQAFGSPLSIPNLLGLRMSADATQLYVLSAPKRRPLLHADGSPLPVPDRLGPSVILPDTTQLQAPTVSTIEVYQPTGNATNPLKHVASYALGNQFVQGFGVAPGLKYPATVLYRQGQVTFFDAGSMTLWAPSAPLGFEDPVISIAVAPDGSRAYVGCAKPRPPYDVTAIIYALVPSGLSGGTPCT
jgi:hypothetical protein